MSISWARLMPDGTKNKIEQRGIDFYNRVLDELVKEGIKPCVTLYHWDLPQALQVTFDWNLSGYNSNAITFYYQRFRNLILKYMCLIICLITTLQTVLFTEPSL